MTNTGDTGAATNYKAYQIFKGDVSANESGNKVLSNVTKGDNLNSTSALVSALLADNTLKTKTNIAKLTTSSSAADIAKAIADDNLSADEAIALANVLNSSSVKTGEGIAFSKDSGEGNKYSATVAPGYYLVTSENGSKLVLGVTDVTVNEKNDYPTVDKKQKRASDETYVDTAISQEIGKVVDYQVEVKIPATANKDITVTDIVSKGLTINTAVEGNVTVGTGSFTTDALTVSGWTQDGTTKTKFTGTWTSAGACKADGTVSETTADNTYTKYTLTIPANLVSEIAKVSGTGNSEAKFVLTYTATVNENAVSKTADSNQASISYEKYTNTDTKVEVTTYGFKLLKYDGSIITDQKTVDSLTDSDVLAGAKFSLYTNAQGTGDPVKLVAENSTNYQYCCPSN